MVISYFGDGCFRLENGQTSLLIDPTNNRLKGDVVLKTISATDWFPSEKEIGFPGEYEIKGIFIRGWQVNEESTAKFLKMIYQANFEEIRSVFLGYLSKPFVDENVLEEIAEPDILFIPAGAEHFLTIEEAAKMVKKLEPAVVVPSFCKSPSEFLKALGQKTEPQEKFVFKKKDLAELKGKAVVLKPNA